ncbi:flotillin-like protein FloA [Mariniblastus sp.]|nr:flotillin-like protein FloA [Mariniblastus sp.]
MSAIQIAMTDFIGSSQLIIAQVAERDGEQFQLSELWSYGLPIALGVAFMIAAAMVLAFIKYGKLWVQAFMSGANVSMLSLIGMEFRKVRPTVIVTAKIMAKQAGLDVSRRTGITTDTLEAHYLAGGDVMRVINAIIAAQRANIDLDFDRAAAIDLAGRDVMDAVKTSVYPKVIDCPDPQRSGKNFLSAMSKDGVELKIRARVTVRTNLEQLIGGATEETIIARVGESIISSIGSAKRHQDVLENPHLISRAVLERGLDAHTAFEIVSIDIADIDVGENIGARLQADQAEADTRVAQAAAAKRRADAIAHEQEMKADVAKQKAQLVLAEADVPHAMAEAFRAGNMLGKAK